uniref:Protein Spindly n=1 Tax=Denticeps clupeoides TaxID=299321 RepID=A0AAY4DZY2_9TELE
MDDVENERELRCKLRETEEALQKAAQYGLELLDDQLTLQNKLEEQRIEMTNALEALEQEKYSLHKEVELKTRMMESLKLDFDAMKKQYEQKLELLESEQGRRHAVELSDCRNKNEQMKAERDKAQLAERQLRHKLELQSQALSNKTEELRALTERAHETMSSEIMEMEAQRMELESHVVQGTVLFCNWRSDSLPFCLSQVSLQQELQENQYKEQQLQLSNSSLQRHVQQLSEEKEEREREAVSYFNALEKAREDKQDLQIQLDQVLQKAQDVNGKGNSLFAEVEDKRAAMERQLISMKVQYQSLQKQHAFSRQELHRMKSQIAIMLRIQGVAANKEQMERLQNLLSEKNSEIEALAAKVQQLESEARRPSVQAAEIEFHDETYYIDLLKMKLSNSEKAAEQLKHELSLQRMKAISEGQRVLEMERKLFAVQQILKQTQSANLNLQIKVDELQMKYEPQELSTERVQKRRREKLPVGNATEGPQPSTKEPPSKKLELPEGVKAGTEPQAPASAEERPPVAPLLPVSATASNTSLPHESKRICISEEPPVIIPNPPRSVPSSSASSCKPYTLLWHCGQIFPVPGLC